MKDQKNLISRRGFITASLAGSAVFCARGKPHDVVAAILKTDAGQNPKTLAFPGAEGFGAYTPGGRGGKILFVTNLEDYHPERRRRIPGSLRAAVDTEGPRIVLFRVSGTIPLKSELRITEPNITIAGQSAPGDGICIKDYDVSVRTSDVVVRYMRFRAGDEMGPSYRKQGKDFSVNGIAMNTGANNVIVDHCSASWSTDEVLSVSGVEIDNITVQWCIISESLNDSYRLKGQHGYGSIIRCNGKVTYHHNLYVSHKSRTPRPGTYGDGSILLDFRNNVIYNSAWGGYSAPDPVRMNYVGNYIKRGPSSLWDCAFLIDGDTTIIYAEDNRMVGRDGKVVDDSECSQESCIPLLGKPATGVRWGVFANATDANKRAEPFPTAPMKTDRPEVAYRRVMSEAGAILPARDAVDVRILEEVRTGRGRIIDSQSEMGGWPELRSAAPARDSDNDGMPDWWELAHGLDPNDPSDAHEDPDGDGYTNIEEFLNGTDPNVKD